MKTDSKKIAELRLHLSRLPLDGKWVEAWTQRAQSTVAWKSAIRVGRDALDAAEQALSEGDQKLADDRLAWFFRIIDGKAYESSTKLGKKDFDEGVGGKHIDYAAARQEAKLAEEMATHKMGDTQ